MKQVLFCALAWLALTGIATAQDCYRSAECDGQALCVEQACMTPMEILPACEAAEECGYNDVCDEGFCKPDGVGCESPAGSCHVDNGWFSCGCADGIGAMGMDEVPPGEEKDDEALLTECVDSLAMTCGEDAPDIMDECTEAQYDACVAYYQKLNALREACDEEVEEPSFAEMKFCCRDIEDDIAERAQCLQDLPLEACADLESCWEETFDTHGIIGIDGGAGDTEVGAGDGDTDDDNRADTGDGEEDTGDGEEADTGGDKEEGTGAEEEEDTSAKSEEEDEPGKAGDASEKTAKADSSSNGSCSAAPTPARASTHLSALIALLFH
jgi:hypothetical protein